MLDGFYRKSVIVSGILLSLLLCACGAFVGPALSIILLIVGIGLTILVYKLVAKKQKKKKASIEKEIEENSNNCGPFDDYCVYSACGCFGNSLRVLQDEIVITKNSGSESYSIPYTEIKSIDTGLDTTLFISYVSFNCHLPYDPHCKEIGQKYVFTYNSENGGISFEKMQEIISFIENKIAEAKNPNVGSSVNQSNGTMQTESNASIQSEDSKLLSINIEKLSTLSFCDKCNTFPDQLYKVTVSQGQKSKSYSLCKNCALRLKQQVDAQNSKIQLS